MHWGLCFFQWALWQSLPQYLTRPQREQLDRVGSWRSQWAQAPASSLEAGFFFLGGMALGGEEKKGEGQAGDVDPLFHTFFIVSAHRNSCATEFASSKKPSRPSYSSKN
jgi:hypothetical protein